MMTYYLICFQKIGTRGLAAVLVSDNIERRVSVGLKGKNESCHIRIDLKGKVCKVSVAGRLFAGTDYDGCTSIGPRGQ